jgi:predicted HTH domain antitoxin
MRKRRLQPGRRTPVSGQYREVGPRGGPERKVTVSKGSSLAPTLKPGRAHSLMIEYGEDVLFSLGLSQEEFTEEARFLLAAKLYELGRLSSGQAASLCEKGRVEFLLSLPRIGVSVSNLREEDAAAEIEFLKRA